jgi:hypothetical protein
MVIHHRIGRPDERACALSDPMQSKEQEQRSNNQQYDLHR